NEARDEVATRGYIGNTLLGKADTVMDNMMDHVRIHCDKKPRCLNVHCHELATPSQPFL
ncbi:hypothetical protein Tco_1288825, partial [Tanacetum coccineum]